ncbi:Non-classical phosphatidylinositol transfer protein (PITP) [Didymosphaeria variabile]|uniref:Phosphatidylinositol transfer protein SFH5 n=1 Tax=Didymosphaeria variabile TaxID=1932322 RepID=A0A9W8XG28_9PLEO|nr:Non-classical phosphatidylinositol transfer protein (PITP) [Didymosphaeria variabile]KAJ4349991.1 Non-classical phosphatidylinositol transfer protein (PITP) [Didymosphaeria variabile]
MAQSGEMAATAEEPATAPMDAAPLPLGKQPDAPDSASTPRDPVTEKSLTGPIGKHQSDNLLGKNTDDPAATAAAVPARVPGPGAATEQIKPSSTAPAWPQTPAEHPLTKFFSQIEVLTKEAAHDEVYGITLSPKNEFHTKLILQKYLRANQNDLDKAKQQLLDTLKWRKDFDPVKAAGETFERSRFEGLGWLLQVEDVPESANKRDVVTFNIYGAVKDNKKTFGDIDAFLRWRVGLMERSVQHLNLSLATQPIPDFGAGPDPYQGIQVHDYLQVSFIPMRRDRLVNAAIKKTIDVLGRYYPEMLSRKYFVNVPLVMGWVYQAAKMIVSKETAKKFTVLSYGSALAGELGKGLPKEYGGEKGALSEVGEPMKLED